MKRTHPVYLLTQLPRFVWLLLLPLARRLMEWRGALQAGNLPMLLAVLLIFAAAFLRWQTRRWAVQEDTLLFCSGIFLRQQYRIPFSLITAIRESHGPLLYLFGARRIQIETAASRKTAQSITLLLGKKDADTCLAAYTGEKLHPVSHMRPRDTLLAALSTSNFALGLFAAAPILRGTGNLFGTLVQDRFRDVLTSAQRLAASYVPPILTTVALLALLGWALHILKLLELYYHFTLLSNGAVLATESGLLAKRRVFLRITGLSAFAVRQTPPLSFLRRVQLGVIYAGRTGGRGEKTFLMPLFPADRVQTLVRKLQELRPDISLRIPPDERRRAYFPAFGQICALAGAAASAVFFTKAPLRVVFLLSTAAFPVLLLFFFPARRRERREGASADFRIIRTIKGFSEWTLFLLPDALRGMRVFQTPGQAESGVCTIRTFFRTTRRERFSLHNLSLREALSAYKDELDERHVQGGPGADA